MTLSAVPSSTQLSPVDNELKIALPGIKVCIEVNAHDAADAAANSLYNFLLSFFLGVQNKLHKNYAKHKKSVATAKWLAKCVESEMKFSRDCFFFTAGSRLNQSKMWIKSHTTAKLLEGWVQAKPYAIAIRSLVFGKVHFTQ